MRTLSAELATFGLLFVLVGQTSDAGVAQPEVLRSTVSVSATSILAEVLAAVPVEARSEIIPKALPHVPAEGLLDVPAEALSEVIQEYCVSCHNRVRLEGNLSLTEFDVERAPEMAETAEKMIRKLRAGMMPPAGRPRPPADTLMALVEDLERRIDEAAAGNPNPGSRTFQRLTRAEYAAAVRDLLGLEIDVAAYLPLDTKSANFDNIADVQAPSATVMEGYMRAAGYVSRIALGDAEAEAQSTRYRLPRTASQKERVEGAPFGTRGGVSIIHNFPADGKYVFHIQPYPAVEGEVFGRTFGTSQIEVSIDGARVALMTVDRWMHESEPTGLNMRTDSIYVTAGPKRVTAAFVRQFEGEVDDLIRPIDHTLADGQIGVGYGITSIQHLQRLTVLGPYEVTGVSDTPTRRRVFTCRPTAPDEARPCAESIIARLGAQAYRRPLDENDLRGLMQFYDDSAVEDGFEGGVRMALQATLASPHFLFRMEEQPIGASPGEVHRISDVDLASRLSFFIWGTPPDQELTEVAGRGELSAPGEVGRQARRMLADPRAEEALATRFGGQWLRLQDLEELHPDALTFPYFDDTLAESMRRETEQLFSYLIREDRSVLELLTADYTFVNERLARHYGIPGVVGEGFQRVVYPDDRRRGLLGHGSILAMTSHADRTSPVLRGKWVLEVLLGTPPPPPPPDVPAFEETDEANEGRSLTVRERMEQHRSNPACMACHVVIDPIGLALENFDVTGAWRIRDEGNLIDPVGELYDGTILRGPSDLRAALLSRPEVFYRIFTTNLMAYGLGRRVEYFDMPTIRAITRDAAENAYNFSSFVLGVVNSPAFQTTRVDVVTPA
ncbi:MAG TPA: DUF1592 domain-containing protein [Gemmatimonadetes bacterium]|nr:DUF1592 domain-containing protein [Gemmatimonadota bacterium]